ncbi:MAG: ATP-binding protein [Oscillospiraceae bacterium]|nr:ATP-binding protein [Oscillospiraceae bacterium]
MNIKKIVITGGPCAGKSTAMQRVRAHFSAKGNTVLVIPETATELIGGGIAPWTCATPYDYQVIQLRLQAKKEELFFQVARQMNADTVMILCDRGIPDGNAYMHDEDYLQMIAAEGLTPEMLFARYDAVFHLVTAADGALPYYTLANNTARIETPEEAIALDRRTLAAWDGHPYRRTIGNHCSFDEKLGMLIEYITAFLNGA